MAAAFVVVIVVVTLVTLGVGLLGASRTRKDRPSLKSYEQQANTGVTMGLDSSSARPIDSKTDAAKKETGSAVEDPDKSHVRAGASAFGNGAEGASKPSLVKRVCWMLWQLTGIPLLTGFTTGHHADKTDSMGNTAAPTRGATLLSQSTTSKPAAILQSSAEVDTLRDSKAPVEVDATEQEMWSDDEHDRSGLASSEEEDEDQQNEDEREEDACSPALQAAPLLLDGLQFYAAVASVSLATVNHAVDIALFRATTIVLHERRKAHEDAAIRAIETLYPDIMCLPPDADVCYAGPMVVKSIATTATTRSAAISPTATSQLETHFLKAA